MRNSYWIAVAAVVVVLLIALFWTSPDNEELVVDPAADTGVVTSSEAEVAGSGVGAASNAATDEAVEEIVEGQSPTNEEVVDESREIAATEGVVGSELFEPETFDMATVVGVIESSDLSEAEQQDFILALQDAGNNPEELAPVLEDLRLALTVD